MATVTTAVEVPTLPVVRRGIAGWALSTDHKRIGMLIIGTALILMLVFGGMALMMRTQLAQPHMNVVNPQVYAELFTMHGSGMIFLVVTPIALGLGIYLVPLQVGSPTIAAPRTALASYYMYLFGAALMLGGFFTKSGAADAGWFAYVPLSGSKYSPGAGMDLWVAGTFIAGLAMLMLGGTTLWTALRMRAPGMSLLRMPLFTWSMVVTSLMVIASFPALLAAMAMIATARFDPSVTLHNTFNIAYQEVFWFYGHPVVYVMFFPFVGCIAETIQLFSGRKFVGYKWTVIALLGFSTESMAVWGHHMFTTGQIPNNYFSLTSIFLIVPAGLEYFGDIATLIGARIRFTTSMCFALAFLPQFLIGGITGIMLGSPPLDYNFHDTYFVVGHFHYTLFAGSVFGLFAGIYMWFPKVTGKMLDERLGRINFWLMFVGTNVTFLPMFISGYLGMPRRVATYPATAGFSTTNLVSTIGSYIIAIAFLVFIVNVIYSLRSGARAGDNPWGAFTLEWATTSPPPPLNFAKPLPYVTSYTPLLDVRDAEARAAELAKTQAGRQDLERLTAHRPEQDG